MSIIKSIRQYRLFTIQTSSYQFSPGIISTIVTAIMLYIMMSLGFWQLDRAEFKTTLQQTIEARKELPAVSLKELPATMDERRYLPTRITGNYDLQHSFLLDNKTYNSRVGYHVFTPVKISESEAILIARGFIAMGRLREILPEFTTPGQQVELTGVIDKPPSRTIVLADNVQQTERWPVVLQYIDMTELEQMLGYKLYDMVLWLDDSADDMKGNLDYDLPVLNLNAAKNSGYAFQWFAMSLALLIIYIAVNSKRT